MSGWHGDGMDDEHYHARDHAMSMAQAQACAPRPQYVIPPGNVDLAATKLELDPLHRHALHTFNEVCLQTLYFRVLKKVQLNIGQQLIKLYALALRNKQDNAVTAALVTDLSPKIDTLQQHNVASFEPSSKAVVRPVPNLGNAPLISL